MRKTGVALSLCALFSLPVRAEEFQLLHTNDLHSHLEHAPHRPELGGYGRVKVLLDQHRAWAAEQGLPTITMDGGDTMEGNLYYMAKKGRRSLEAFNRLGHDVSVLGNHDYLMGPEDLEAIMKDVPPRAALLGANFTMSKDFPHINEHIRPVWETTVGGVKVGVVGITLSDMLYKWRLKGRGRIDGEVEAARKWARYLKKRGNHVVIALTHIGVKKDRRLAQNVPELDLIVGGHSHTALHEVVYQKSEKGKLIPIVQAGRFGEWLGRIVLDYDHASKRVTIKDYGLLPTLSETKDKGIEALIEAANEDLFGLYGKDWLEEVVGHSELRPLTVKDDSLAWHFFINDAMLEASGADMSVHASALSGDNYPVGPVTRRDVYNGNPRSLNLDDKEGNNIYTAKVNGHLLKTVAKICLNMDVPLYFSGISFQWKIKKNGDYHVWDLRHKGKRIKVFKRYKVSFGESIVRGAWGISPLTRLVLQQGRNTGVSMWRAVTEKFEREGTLRSDYLETYYQKGLLGDDVMERTMVPAREE